MGFGDCVFWSIVCLVAITFVWLKFIEPFLPVWLVLPITGIISFLLFVYRGSFRVKGRNERRKEGIG